MFNKQLFENLKGVIVPTVTPLDGDERIDVGSTKKLIEYLLAGGVHGLFLLGTTGEYVRLADKEKDEFVDICAGYLNRRALLSVNVSDMGTKKIIRNIRVAEKYSPDFVALSIPAYFVINTAAEQYDFFKNITESTDLPIMIYNIPCCTGGYIKVECIEKLLRHKNIIGIKDSSGNLDYLKEIADLTKNRNFAIFNGHEGMLFEAFAIGAKGVISSSANIFPAEVTALYNSFITGDLSVRDKYYDMLNTFHASKSEFNDNIYGIYAIKYILAKKMLCKANVTKPYCHDAKKDRIIEEFYNSISSR